MVIMSLILTICLFDAVWSLYAKAVERFGDITFMIERDDNIPSLDELMQELNLAREISKNVLHDAYTSGNEADLVRKLQAGSQPAVLQKKKLSV